MASKSETVRSIRAEWKEETGVDPGRVGAEILLDQMAEAFFQISQGVGLAEASHRDRRTAEYLKWQWTGDEGAALRETLAMIDEADHRCTLNAAECPGCQAQFAASKARREANDA